MDVFRRASAIHVHFVVRSSQSSFARFFPSIVPHLQLFGCASPPEPMSFSSDGSSRIASSAPNHSHHRLFQSSVGRTGHHPTSSVSVARSTLVSPFVSRSGLLGDCPSLAAVSSTAGSSCLRQHELLIASTCGFCRAPTRFCSEVHTHRDTDCLLHASLIRCVSIQAVRARHRKRQHRCVDLCFFVGERIVLWLFMPRRACFAYDL